MQGGTLLRLQSRVVRALLGRVTPMAPAPPATKTRFGSPVPALINRPMNSTEITPSVGTAQSPDFERHTARLAGALGDGALGDAVRQRTSMTRGRNRFAAPRGVDGRLDRQPLHADS
jgi:hypothetical protein